MSIFSKKEFAARLCQVKETLGVSLKDMAEKAEVKKPQTMRNYLEGAALPNVQTVAALALNMGVDSMWLLTGEGEMLTADKSGADPAAAVFHPELIPTADTLRNVFEDQLVADLDEVAHVGGMSRACLDACLASKMQPPLLAVARWVAHYKLNANYLAAQFGEPLLTDEDMNGGPLEEIAGQRWAREALALEEGKSRPSAFVGYAAAGGDVDAASELGRELADVRKEFERVQAPAEVLQQAMLETIKSRRGPAVEETDPREVVGSGTQKAAEVRGPRTVARGSSS